MLQVNELDQYYGGSHILRGLTFEARVGEVTCLLGRNGVGKTTLLKCLIGLVPIKNGSITWEGKNISHQSPHQRVKEGIAYVPQGREIFPGLQWKRIFYWGFHVSPVHRVKAYLNISINCSRCYKR